MVLLDTFLSKLWFPGGHEFAGKFSINFRFQPQLLENVPKVRTTFETGGQNLKASNGLLFLKHVGSKDRAHFRFRKTELDSKTLYLFEMWNKILEEKPCIRLSPRKRARSISITCFTCSLFVLLWSKARFSFRCYEFILDVFEIYAAIVDLPAIQHLIAKSIDPRVVKCFLWITK